MPHKHDWLVAAAPRGDQRSHVLLAGGVVPGAPEPGIVEAFLHIHDNQSCASGHGPTLAAATEDGSSRDIAYFDSPAASRSRRGIRAVTELRPELVPSKEIVEVLPHFNNPAVLEPEDDAVGNVQVLALSLRAAALNADDVVVVICKQVPQFGPEGPSCLLP
jgi:hypothetical protein